MATAVRRLAVVTAVAVGCLALAAGAPAIPAAAADVTGSIHLSVVADAAAMAAMTPGEPVPWDVGVTTDVTGPATVTVSLDAATNSAGVFTREVLSCTQAWTATGCPGTEHVLRAAAPVVAADGDRLVSFPASDTRWFRVLVTMAADPPAGATADFTLHATGVGADSSVTTGGGSLATTGADVRGSILLASGAIAAGILLAGFARRRRDDDDPGAPDDEPEVSRP